MQQLDSMVATGQISPNMLILEITETSAMEDRESALEALVKLNDSGFKISIDDFGTGYCSLSYLDEMPVHEVKIDRSFILKMKENENDDTVVRATIHMGHELGFKVLAEGVEDKSIVEQLKRRGCDLAQGYYFSKPQPRDDVLAWLTEHSTL